MIDIGRACVKLAGRDAGKRCVVVDQLDDHTVLIDGETRRRKCNISHLEPLTQTLKVKKGASHDEVGSAIKSLGWALFSPKSKEKKTERPRRARKVKQKVETKKSVKKAEKKAAKAEKSAKKSKKSSKKAPKPEQKK